MAITTYDELKVAVADWLARDDLTERIPDFIRLAETALQKVLRDSRMVATATLTLTDNDYSKALPADVLDVVLMQTGAIPLEQINVPQLTVLRRHRLKAPGIPKYYAIVGRNAHFAPRPATSTAIECHYYQEIPPLGSGTPSNWLLADHPDIYLHAALLQAQPFLRDDARAAAIESMVSRSVQLAIQNGNHMTLDALKRVGYTLSSPADAPVAEPSSAIATGA